MVSLQWPVVLNLSNEPLSDEQMGQMYELMKAIRNQDADGGGREQS